MKNVLAERWPDCVVSAEGAQPLSFGKAEQPCGSCMTAALGAPPPGALSYRNWPACMQLPCLNHASSSTTLASWALPSAAQEDWHLQVRYLGLVEVLKTLMLSNATALSAAV